MTEIPKSQPVPPAEAPVEQRVEPQVIPAPETDTRDKQRQRVATEVCTDLDAAKVEFCEHALDSLDDVDTPEASPSPQEAPPATPAETKNKVSSLFEKYGFNTGMKKFGEWMKKAGEWMKEAWDYVKPHLMELMSLPMFRWMVGKENGQKLQEWLGLDDETLKLFQNIRDRLPEQVKFTGTGDDRRHVIAFTDAFNRMAEKRGTAYTKEMFVSEILDQNNQKSSLKFTGLPTGPDQKKQLSMEQMTTAARALVDATTESSGTPPAVSAAPSTTPAPQPTATPPVAAPAPAPGSQPPASPTPAA